MTYPGLANGLLTVLWKRLTFRHYNPDFSHTGETSVKNSLFVLKTTFKIALKEISFHIISK